MSWIEDLKSDEEKVLANIYMNHRNSCISWLETNFKISQSDGIEVFQNAVIILYDNVIQGKITIANSSLKTYLFSIAKNKAYEILKARKRLKFNEDFDLPALLTFDNQEEKITQELQFQAIEKALLKLGDPCKKLLQLFYYKKKKMEEIKELMNYENSDTVKTAKYKCMKRIKKLVN